MKQRRVLDRWGRMMLLMPNRKYHSEKIVEFYDFYVHDYLDKMFALSLLNDEDYNDLVMTEDDFKKHQVYLY